MGSMCCSGETTAAETEKLFDVPEDPLMAKGKSESVESGSIPVSERLSGSTDIGRGSVATTEGGTLSSPTGRKSGGNDMSNSNPLSGGETDRMKNVETSPKVSENASSGNMVSTDNDAVKDGMENSLTGKVVNTEPEGVGDGAYLVYSPQNEGTFYVMWRKERIPDAVAYAKPREGIRIPPFKYKGRSEIVRSLNKSKKAPLDGILQFFRSMQPFQCEAKLLAITDPSFRIPELVFFGQLINNTVQVMEPNGEFLSLPNTNMIAACIANTIGETDMRAMTASGEISLNAFQLRCKRNAEYVESISLLGPEI